MASNDNRARTAAEKADPAHWQAGDVIMLHPEARTADKKPHPHAGRLGKIAVILSGRPTNLLTVGLEVVAGAGAGTDTYAVLPAGMFLAVPEFCVEIYQTRPGYSGWRLSAEGRRVLVEGMGWPVTPASLGGKLADA